MSSTKGGLAFLNQRIVETVDLFLKCSKNREANLMARLRSLWKQRSALMASSRTGGCVQGVGGEEAPPASTGEPGSTSKVALEKSPES